MAVVTGTCNCVVLTYPSQTHETVRIANRHSSQKQPVDGAEYRSVRAHTQRERQNDHGCPAFALQKHSCGVTEILKHGRKETTKSAKGTTENHDHPLCLMCFLWFLLL